MNFSARYILKGTEPVACPDLLQWGQWMETADRIVEETFVQHPLTQVVVRISTIFLGLDHRYSADGPPILFETMAFGAPEQLRIFGADRLWPKSLGYQNRYCTWDEAVAGHHRVHQDVARSMAIEASERLHEPHGP